METIKAFNKDGKGYYCQPAGEKFYYEEGKTYTVPREKVELCKFGFHASANYDISETAIYYKDDFKKIHYGIVDLNTVDRDNHKSVGNKITIIKFLPQDFDILSKYDKTGEWICWVGYILEEFDYKKGLEKLLKVDKEGDWIYSAGDYWKEFDYKMGFKKLLEVDKTGEWICCAGNYWKEFDYKKGYEKLLEVDKANKWIPLINNNWKEKI